MNTPWIIPPRGWTLPEIACKAVTYNKSPSIDVCVDVQGVVAASDSCSSISNYSSTCRQLGPPPFLFSQSLISDPTSMKPPICLIKWK
jgi:hypothetical protein